MKCSATKRVQGIKMQRVLQIASRQVAKPLLPKTPTTTINRTYAVSSIDSVPSVTSKHRLCVPTVQAMDCLAALFASHIRPGDCYCLFGAVGAGKSVFSRAFIRAVAEDDFLPVPSPTFLLQNTYNEHQGPPIHHFDFYRLASIQDFNRLDLDGSLARAVCLMEWPERLPSLPSDYLAVRIEVADAQPSCPKLANGGMSGHSNSCIARTSSCDASAGVPSFGHKLARGRAFLVEDSDCEGHAVAGSSSPEDIDTEEDSDEFTDRRPRFVTLTPQGSYWEGRTRRIISYISAHSHACDGLVVLDESSAAAAATGAVDLSNS